MTDQKQNGKFDIRAFMARTYTPREGNVSVPALREYFGDGHKPAWKVRGLTADEIARCNEAAEKNRKVQAIIEALTSSDKMDMIDGMRKLLGISTDVHGEVAKRLEQLTIASVEPEITLNVAVKLATVFPVEFYTITNKILELTGLGQIPGKAKPSGIEKTSTSAST